MSTTLARRLMIIGFSICALLILNPVQDLAARPKPTEYDVKAAFLYQFTRFVEWPSSAFADSNSPFVIGILGDDPFGHSLDDAVRGKDVAGRRIVVKRSGSLSELTNYQMLYVSASEGNRVSSIIDKAGQSNALTVSDIERFAREGGIIELKTTDGKVGFEINTTAAKRSALKISSKLLRLASSVR